MIEKPALMRPVRGWCWTCRYVSDSCGCPGFGCGEAHRWIGQERLRFTAWHGRRSSLDELSGLIDGRPITFLLNPIHATARGEAAWPPLAMFKALLPSVWYDLSDVKLGEALDVGVVPAVLRLFRRRACAGTHRLRPISQGAGGRRAGSRPVRGGDRATEGESGSGEDRDDHRRHHHRVRQRRR